MDNTKTCKVIIIFIVLMLILYLSSLKISKQKFLNRENFNNNIIEQKKESLKEIDGECKNIYTLKELCTPTSVNIPTSDYNIKTPVFNTCKNYSEKVINELKGKYCFPIEKLMYDGLWDSNIKDFNKNYPEKQQRQWTMSDKVKTHGLYCGDQLLKLPEKTLCVGDEVISSNDCAKFYPKPSEVEEKIKECTFINTCLEPTCFEKNGLIETTDGRWNINAL